MEKQLSFKDRQELRKWLDQHHDSRESVWVEFYKDKRPGVSYPEALEEALCFGWIDSLIKRIDDRIYVRKFSKRTIKSKWSEKNKKLASWLLTTDLMTEWGRTAIETARKNGQWDVMNRKTEIVDVKGFRSMIDNYRMREKYDVLGAAAKKMYARYFFDAKKEETRRIRLLRIYELLDGKRKIV